MNPTLKKILIVIGALFILLIVAAAVIPMVVEVDKYRPRVVQAVNQRINGKFELGKMDLSLWGQVRVEVAGLTLSDSQGRKVLAVKDAYFHLPFLSILSGSPAVSFRMDKPEVNVIKDKFGKLNVMTLAKTEAQPGQPSAPAAGKPAPQQPVSLPGIVANSRLNLELRQAAVTYRDEATGLDTQVKELNASVRDLSLTRTSEFEIWADLDTSLGKTFLMKGPARVTGKAKPQIAGGKLDQLSFVAKADLDGVEMTVPGKQGEPAVFQKKKGMATNADLALAVSEREAKIDKLDARFFNAEIRSQGLIANLGTAPSVDLRVRSNEIELKSWVELLPMLKEYELGGSASLEAQAKGPADKLGYDAQLKVNALTAKAPMLKAQPRFDAVVKVATDQIESLVATMKAPGNEARLSGKLISFSQPRGEFRLESSGMDLDQLVDFPKKEAAKAEKAGTAPAQKGATGTQPQESDYDALLAPLRENKVMQAFSGKLDVNVKSMKAYNVQMSDIQGSLAMKDLAARLEGFGMKLFGGGVSATATMQLKPKTPTYQFTGKASGLQLEQAVASQMQLLKNTVVGRASKEISGEGASFNPQLAMKNLRAKGKLRVENAKFTTIDVAKMTVEALNGAIEKIGEKVPAIKSRKIGGIGGGRSEYEYMTTDFTIAGGKFSAPNFVAKALPNKGIDVKGSLEVGMIDTSLAARWEVADTFNLTHAKDLAPEVNGIKIEHILAEGNQPVKFPITIGGTVSAPSYSYGEVPEYLAKVALGNVNQALQAKAKAEVRKKAEELIPKSAPPAVQEKLKRFFGR